MGSLQIKSNQDEVIRTGAKASSQEERARTHERTHARREEGRLKMEAETGVLRRQVKELELRHTQGFQQHQMLEKGMKQILPQGL